MWFGFDWQSKAAVIVVVTFFPMLVNTLAGLASVDAMQRGSEFMLGFISEEDPLFRRTYAWLHSPHYQYSYSDQPYGLPGSYRLQFTTSWAVADHLRLNIGRDQALKILRHSPWDGGIITEGVKADTGVPDRQGLAFATAAGYVAHTICEQYCIDRK